MFLGRRSFQTATATECNTWRVGRGVSPLGGGKEVEKRLECCLLCTLRDAYKVLDRFEQLLDPFSM